MTKKTNILFTIMEEKNKNFTWKKKNVVAIFAWKTAQTINQFKIVAD